MQPPSGVCCTAFSSRASSARVSSALSALTSYSPCAANSVWMVGIGRQSRLQALLRQFCQRERRSPQSLCAGLQPRQFKHLPHTAVHPLRLLLNDTQIVCLLFRCKVITEQLGGGAEHGERRFQLVRECGSRFAAYPLYALLFAPDAQLRTGQHCRAE